MKQYLQSGEGKELSSQNSIPWWSISYCENIKKNTSFNCFSHTEIIIKQVFKECALEKKKNSEDIGCLKLWCDTVIIMSKNVRNSKWTLKIQVNVYVYYKPIIILG